MSFVAAESGHRNLAAASRQLTSSWSWPFDALRLFQVFQSLRLGAGYWPFSEATDPFLIFRMVPFRCRLKLLWSD